MTTLEINGRPPGICLIRDPDCALPSAHAAPWSAFFETEDGSPNGGEVGRGAHEWAAVEDLQWQIGQKMQGEQRELRKLMQDVAAEIELAQVKPVIN